MNQYDGVLKMYADSGLRTVEDWINLGREIPSGVKSRLDTKHRGEVVALYSRDQTQIRPRSASPRNRRQVIAPGVFSGKVEAAPTTESAEA